MSVSQAWQSDNFDGLTPHQLGLLYEPIVLELALQKAGSFPTSPHEKQSTVKYEAEMPDFEAFQFYVNKLAQVCDNERGGNTISALAILQGSRGPNYVFGFNSRDTRGLQTTQNFVKALLHLVGENPEGFQTAALGKRVLWFILSFNLPRLKEYLRYLSEAVQECLESCKRQEEEETSEPMQSLLSLADKCKFELNMSESNTEDKSISDCDTLIKAIVALHQDVNKMISQRAKDGEMARSEPWCNLRHFLGRWLSYRKAALGIVAISERWPDLFLDFEITMVPSGPRVPNPILRSDLTSSIIMQHIVAEDKIQDTQLLQAAEDLEQMGIDDIIIRDFQLSRRFRPLLHAEILVHEYLLKKGLTAVECYWNRWGYIGGSKPTCRLCHYYFDTLESEKPCVRSSHNNLYRNWRLPEYHDEESLGIARDVLLSKLAQRLRADVVETLKEKKIRRKARDSNTYSSFPDTLRFNNNSSTSINSSDGESTASTGPPDEDTVQLESATGALNLGD